MKDKITRTLTLDRANIDKEQGLIPASLTSSNVIHDNISGATRLIHTADAIDMTRAKDGLPITWERHGKGSIVGRAVDFTLDGDVTRANLKITRNPIGRELLQDIQDGIITDVSIGAAVLEHELDDSDVMNITRWQPYEVTTGMVCADVSIGINRDQPLEDKAMTDETVTRDKGNEKGDGANVIDYQQARESAKAQGIVEGGKIERKRISDIDSLFSGAAYQAPEYQDLKRAMIDTDQPIEKAQRALLDLIGTGTAPATGEFRQDAEAHTFQHGAEQSDKFSEGLERALEVRLGLEKDAEVIKATNKEELAGMNMTELAREYCRRNQIGMVGKNREQTIGLALTRAVIGHGTSDFANVLENVMNKSLLAGWEETDESWQTWCRTGTLPDFKQGSRTNVSAFSDLEVVYEDGEYKYGTFSDLKETIQLITYGKLFNISRQSLANDDLNSLSLIPRAMGRAANRTVGDQAYNLLTQASGLGPTLNQDSTALFDAAGHSNYYTGAGAPTVATVNTMVTAMATQTDPSGNATLNIIPKYLVVPHALRATASVLMAAAYDPTTAGDLKPNSVSGIAQVVVDARLDAASTTAWYMMADQNMHDTCEIAFLNGQTTPYTESREGWTIDGTEFKVRIDAAAAALDFRGMQKHAGA